MVIWVFKLNLYKSNFTIEDLLRDFVMLICILYVTLYNTTNGYLNFQLPDNTITMDDPFEKVSLNKDLKSLQNLKIKE